MWRYHVDVSIDGCCSGSRIRRTRTLSRPRADSLEQGLAPRAEPLTKRSVTESPCILANNMPDIEEATMLHFLTTRRLGIRTAHPSDAEFIHGLWTSPDVMRFVGFPEGLAITVSEVRKGIERDPDSEFRSRLIVELRSTQVPIGQCKIGTPDSEGICEPDIKLKPEYWGNGYGSELWAAMIEYAFAHSSADIVQGTPNRANIASVRMQLGSGMIQVDEGVFPNLRSPHPGAVPVPYYKLQITREQWHSLPR